MATRATVITGTADILSTAGFAAREWYYDALKGREFYPLVGGWACESETNIHGDMKVFIDPGLVDGHKHRVPPITVTFPLRDQFSRPSVMAVIDGAIRQAIDGWDYWEHGGERRARVVRALKRRPFQPRWVSAHCGCPDHATAHRLDGAR